MSMPPPDNKHPTTQEFLQRYATREQNANDAYDAQHITRSSSMKRGGSGKYKNGKQITPKKAENIVEDI